MNKNILRFLVIFLLITFSLAGEKRKMTTDDCFRVKEISDIQMSPGGEQIVFVMSEVVSDKNKKDSFKRTYDIYALTLADNVIRRLTTHEKGSYYPRWSLDGRYLAFLSNRTEKNQIWLLDMELGGEATQLTDWKSGIEKFAWSPGSKRIAFISSDPPEDGEGGPSQSKKDDPYVITRTKYLFDGVGYFGDPREYQHIYVVDLSDPKNPTKVTDGPFDDTSIFWSPAGNEIGFVSNRTGDDDNNDNTDIWVVPADGEELRQITTNIGSDGGILWWDDCNPRWSPDGKYIAYHSNPEPNNLYTLNRLCLIPADGGEPQWLSKDLDRDVIDIVWSKDSRFIYGLIPDKSRVHVYKFAITGDKFSKVVGGDNRVYQLAISEDSAFLAFILENNDHPNEIFTASLEKKDLKQRTWLNKPLLDEVLIGKIEKIQFKNPDLQTVEGFVLKPPDFEPGQKYPLIVEIHGGPQATDGNYYVPQAQWYAANGYVVLWVNYRGSSDYGQAWQDAIAGDWYFKEYDDVMAAVDYMCQQDYIDPQRLGVTGVSYGGIMTTWIVGQTNRFAAAVAERFIVDNFSVFGVDDEAYYYEKDFGLPYDEDNFNLYRKTSPIFYIKNCTTPILLMQCMEDHRCPLPQALQFYMGLKKLKKTDVELVLYPRESHGIGEIPHQKDRLERIVDWFDKYLKR